MTKVFRDYDQAALDAQYEQRAWVPHADDIIRRYAAASEAVRRRLPPAEHRYGEREREALDLYGDPKAAAMLVFVHGGAWKRQSRREQGFAAEAIVGAGASFAALGFDLLPTVTMAEMAAQVCRGIEWLKERFAPRRLVLCGHSSGAHLAACALTRLEFIDRALVVSGLYDLLPVRLSARNEYVRLDERLEHDYSPIRHLERIPCPVSVAWGEHEAPEFARQSREFAAALAASGKLAERIEARGLNHFEIIETLANPASPLGRAAVAMVK